MSQDTSRRALRSEARVVVVEAPAGCGKTFEAAVAASDLACNLAPQQEALLLAHTNAAVQEFRSRVRHGRGRVRALTLDAFALEIVAPYSRALGLPDPLRVGEPEGVSFTTLAPKLTELFQRSPSIARSVGLHYPVIVLDEHQDARQQQHQAVELLAAAAATQLRVFGDPMQAIYDFSDDEMLNWESLRANADIADQLDEPHRWDHDRELGDWILASRNALQRGQPAAVRAAPVGRVQLVRVPGLEDLPNPNSRAVPPPIVSPLLRLLNELQGSVAVLARYNAHVFALRLASKGRLRVNEGVDNLPAYEAFSRAIEASVNPRALADAVLYLISETSTGLTAAIRGQLSECLAEDRIDVGKKKRVRSFLECLAALYSTPDLSTWCRVVERIYKSPPDWIQIHLPASFQVLRQLLLSPDEDPRTKLDRVVRARKETGYLSTRSASTIHKAKGREFDHVIIAHCNRSHFPDTPAGRRLLYVALSRARCSIHILASASKPSPLLD